jgi:hypothetical protein
MGFAPDIDARRAAAVGTWLCLAVAWAGPAAGQEFCVICAEPAATYRCVIENAQPGGQQSLQMLCVTRLAQEAKHGQCSIQRNVTVFQCDGPVRKVSTDPAVPVAPAQAATPTPAVTPPGEPPKTVAEAARRAQEAGAASMQTTKSQLERASEATFGFLRDTAVCIGTLFTRCGAKPASP